MASTSTARQINLVINKLTKATLDELSSSGRLSGELSNQLFMTTDENESGCSVDILYMSQDDYDKLEPKDPSKYYATPGTGGSGAGTLSNCAVLSGGNNISGYNLISSVGIYDTFSTNIISSYNYSVMPINIATCSLGKASTVPTPDSTDNSDAIATTQFVKAIAGNNKIVLVDTAPTDENTLEQNTIYAMHESTGYNNIIKLTNLYMKSPSQFIKLTAGGSRTVTLEHSGKYRVKLIGCSGYNIIYTGTSKFYGSGAYFDGFIKLDAGSVTLNCPVGQYTARTNSATGAEPYFMCRPAEDTHDPLKSACIKQGDNIIFASNATTYQYPSGTYKAILKPDEWTISYIPILSGDGSDGKTGTIQWLQYSTALISYNIQGGQLSNYITTNPLTRQLGIDNGKNMTPSTTYFTSYESNVDYPYYATESGVPGYVYLEYVGPWT